MSDPYDRDAEDSELYGDRRFYGPQIPIINGNYNKIIVAWASLITLIVVSIGGYSMAQLYQEQREQNRATYEQAQEIIRNNEHMKRLDERADFMQREIERLQQR